MNKSPNKGKFEARRIEGLFVGYSSTSKAYRIWVPNERKVVITRDVRFINKLQSDNKYEDIISGQTMNGRYKVLNESSADVEENETEIGPSIASEVNLQNFNDIEIYHSMIEPLEDENDNNDVIQIRRSPGRPRKIREPEESDVQQNSRT